MKTIKQIRIYIIEDNKAFAHALKADIETAFEKTPIKIQLFETGEKCMQQFKEEKPQVVILDYCLNSMHPEAADGIKILDWIKKENNETNVILLTSDDTIDIAIKSFKHGASDYVVKTETQFTKINYSLSNLFKMIKAKNEVRIFKYTIKLLLCFIALQIGVVIAILIFAS